MVCVKIIAIFFSFCLFKLLNKFVFIEQGKYCQSQLFTTTHDMNILTDLYCSKRKRYRA